jgi:hypothetical protein
MTGRNDMGRLRRLAKNPQVLSTIVVIFMGVAVLLSNLGIKHVVERNNQQAISSACSSASSRVFPHLLSDDAELQKALAWARQCARLNGVHAATIKLPPVPSTTTTVAPKSR